MINTITKDDKKIVIIGVSASGKTTFAKRLASKTGLPLTLMDSIMWRPDWEYVGDDTTEAELKKISVKNEWIIEGYITKKARSFLFDRADKIIYLDYNPTIASFRYIKRWLKHRKHAREELQGCSEKFSFKFLKLVWTKGEAVSLNKFLKEEKYKTKIIRFTKISEAENFLAKVV